MKPNRYLPVLIGIMRVITAEATEMWFNGSDNEAWPPLNLTCRTETGLDLPIETYRLDTCARCYSYLPVYAFTSATGKLNYTFELGHLFDAKTHTSYKADPKNTSQVIYKSFQSEIFARKWVSCCKAAVECCLQMSTEPPLPYTGQSYCPRTWDGWQCWPDTVGGQTAISPCQEHVYFMSDPPSCPRYATKSCWKNGTWFVNEWNSEWTNYSSCGLSEGIRRHQHFYIATFAVSILFLLPALVIFTTYKQLQVHRITMHKNLFCALLLNAVMNIVFKAVVIQDELDNSGKSRTLLEENGVMCKLLYLLTKYTRLTTYMWMFSEGFYLHKLIAAAFAEQKSLAMFYIIGWVFPIFPVATFALFRWHFADEQCWAVLVMPYEWIISGHYLLSLVLNLIFLCNIIRVLVTKLRAAHANEPSQFRKAVRATFVLVPLFGLHFIFTIYRPQSAECSVLEGYTFFNIAMDGLQGFLVSLLFCYLNGEIQGLVRRTFQRYRLQQKFTSTSEWRRSTRSEPTPNKMATRSKGPARPYLCIKE